jgi:hypothetical protein
MGISTIDNKLVYQSSHEALVIEPWGRDGLRVRATPLPEIIDRPWALTEPVDTQAKIEISDTGATIRNGNVSAQIRDIFTQKGHVAFFKHAGDTMIPILSEYSKETFSAWQKILDFVDFAIIKFQNDLSKKANCEQEKYHPKISGRLI